MIELAELETRIGRLEPTTIKPSHAMMIGSEKVTPLKGIFLARGPNGENMACALGAMVEFVEPELAKLMRYYGHSDNLELAIIKKLWPNLQNDLLSNVEHRFDYKHESMPEIAHWLAEEGF